MSTNRSPDSPAGFSLADIYFVVFRRKWLILILTLLGLGAGEVYYLTRQPLYQSDALVLIRYVSDSHPANSSGDNSRFTSMTDSGQSVMNSEMAILGSLDLAEQAATNIGPEKILAKFGGGDDAVNAAMQVRAHLKVDPIKESSVINLTFSHPDPDMVRPVLSEIIRDYQEKHALVHTAIGLTRDALSDQAEQMHLAIAQTEESIRIAKTNAGIISLPDAQSSWQNEWSRIRSDLYQAKADLAEREGSHPGMGASMDTQPASTNSMAPTPPAQAPADKRDRYNLLAEQLKFLDGQRDQYIDQGYSLESKPVRENRNEAASVERDKAALEKQFPALAVVASPPRAANVTSGPVIDPRGEPVEALRQRVRELQAQFDEIQQEASRLNDAAARIEDLERTKKIQEDNYQAYLTMLQQARLNEAVGPGSVPNIQVIQQPSPPYKDFNKFHKVLAMLCVSGLLAGLALAFLMEFYLDRTVKRPEDLMGKLRVPFYISIPELSHPPRKRLVAAHGDSHGQNGMVNGSSGVMAHGLTPMLGGGANPALRLHYDALRDRLVRFFESTNLTRKPKLVAVTSTCRGAGVSSIAAGLAASLSDLGEGRVLLVELSRENGAAQQFVRGEPGCRLDDALMHLIFEGAALEELPRFLPKRVASLVPKLRASDYDYILFDMPPVSQTSLTTRLAGLMDTVLLVIESEKTDRDVVQQANQLLLQSKAVVATVLNKTRNYVPGRLARDIHTEV